MEENKSSVSVVSVENFPSRVELYKLIDNILKESGMPLSYRVENKDNSLKFFFSSSESALEVIKKLNEEKMSNKYYNKLMVALSFENKNNNTTKYTLTSITSKSHHPKSTVSYKSYSSKDSSEEMSYIHRHMLDISSKAGIMRNDSPYVEEERAFRLREKNKEKNNISKQRFNPYFSKATVVRNSSRFISNYVNLTPSIPVNQFKFRSNDKSKWMNKNGFRLY